ncbi:SAM-dependent DNA methyltransferase [Candidatus Obscuribacterales bacterium]|nr:SAM-dependent DNA methyltransferase [Candidatus Obscuribacterales bacterium]
MPTAQETKSVENRRQEIQQAVDNACNQMRSEGVHPRDYVEQLSWLFFLKAFEETENKRAQEAEFEQVEYHRVIDDEYRWSSWTKLRNRPADLLTFVNAKLWPHLCALEDGPVAGRVRRIFSAVKNHQSSERSAASFARVIEQVDRLRFSDKTDVIVLSEIYERLLKDVAQVSGYAGEFYTPRHIIRLMVQVVQPQVTDRVYDPCFGSAGFLSECADEMRRCSESLSAQSLDKFHNSTFFGREMQPLAYLMGTMGLLLHGINDPVLELANTLEVHSQNVSEKDKYSVILANPPYGGKMAQQLQTNFTVRSGSTEILFLQHIMANLAKGGRAAVVVPEGVLFRGGPDAKVRERLLREFNVHTVLSLSAGCFLPYTGVKANVIFFNRERNNKTTESVWFYELANDGFELKTTRKPIPGNQIPDFLSRWKERSITDNSWLIPLSEIEANGWNLSAKNPNRENDYELKPARELIQSIKVSEQRVFDLLEEIEQLLEKPEENSNDE